MSSSRAKGLSILCFVCVECFVDMCIVGYGYLMLLSNATNGPKRVADQLQTIRGFLLKYNEFCWF